MIALNGKVACIPSLSNKAASSRTSKDKQTRDKLAVNSMKMKVQALQECRDITTPSSSTLNHLTRNELKVAVNVGKKSEEL